MIREIKFRAWVSHQKQFWYPGTIIRVSLGEDLQKELGEDIILMQFTGLKDKNGKEIYEGDIVHHGKNAVSPVEFHDGSFTVATTSVMHRRSNELKVIGNIYENPELLK